MTSPRALAVAALLIGTLLAVAALAFWPPRAIEPRAFDPAQKLDPPARLRVLWVGHSLMNHRDPDATPSRNLLERVGDFSRERGVGYEAVDHTLFGAPLSLLWRGSPHSYPRSEPATLERRRRLLESPVDALVLTEGIPVGRSLDEEHSAYYAHEFRCAVLQRNPSARVYVYESWSHLFASDEAGGYPRPSVYDFGARLAADRRFVERLSDIAATGEGARPSPFGRLLDVLGQGTRCTASNVYLVPVGTVFRELTAVLRAEEIVFRGRPMGMSDLFANPYASWPDGWPRAQALPAAEEAAVLASLTTIKRTEPLDDIHPSDLGIYVVSLVHFATLYARTPVGLAYEVHGLPETSARRLQQLVWTAVTGDARTGVGATFSQ